MDSVISYNAQSVLVDSLCVEDIGNCALEATDEMGGTYYIVIKTIRGHTHILEWGPIVIGVDALPKTYSVNYSTTTYTDVKMEKYLKKWALGPKGVNFTDLKQVSVEEAYSNFKNAVNYFIDIS